MRKRFVCYLSFFFTAWLVLAMIPAQAESYYDQHAVGWHWYDDPKPDKSPANALDNPVTQMAAIKQALNTALDKALLQPTPQNVRQYIALQNQTSDRASRFARIWQLVLLQHPELDYSIAHPTNQVGREVYEDQKHVKEDAAIRALAAHSGLFFFYRSSCPYCQRFAPIVKAFSEQYHLAVIPITTDGIALPSFPDSRPDNGQAAKFHVEVEPALFTVNPYTHKAIPVGYGLMTEEALRQRILDIATNFQGDD